MPVYWYSIRDTKEFGENSLNRRIVAPYKPYFMIYVYPALKSKYNQFLKNSTRKVIRKFREYEFKSISDIANYPQKTKDMLDFLSYYEADNRVGRNPCVVNRVCWLFEKEFPSYSKLNQKAEPFDYSILKCNTEYSKSDYKQIKQLYSEYKMELDSFRQRARLNRVDDSCGAYTKEDFINRFRMESRKICSNEQELCDIVLDICYQTEQSKQFAWDVAGDIIIKNLLDRNNYTISYPKHEGSEFEYCGEKFSMRTLILEDGDRDNYIE